MFALALKVVGNKTSPLFLCALGTLACRLVYKVLAKAETPLILLAVLPTPPGCGENITNLLPE